MVVTALSFNRRGTYLAVGWSSGVVVVWDTISRSAALRIPAHAMAVSSVGWNRRGDHLLTAGYDGFVVRGEEDLEWWW